MLEAFRLTGRLILDASWGTGFGLLLFFQSAYWLKAIRKRWADLVNQLHFSGVKSLGVVLVVALFTGMIISVQVGRELSRFQQEDTVGGLVAVTICREMGPFMTAIILAATVGSAMAAELGTMKVSEEIDALEVMSIPPAMYLVMPRILALTVMCPLLTLVTDLVATFGGAIVSRALLGVSYYGYFDKVQSYLTFKDVYTGLVKAVMFGMVVASVGCAQGLMASGGARGVGVAVRNSVMYSLLLILVIGYFMTRFFFDVT